MQKEFSSLTWIVLIEVKPLTAPVPYVILNLWFCRLWVAFDFLQSYLLWFTDERQKWTNIRRFVNIHTFKIFKINKIYSQHAFRLHFIDGTCKCESIKVLLFTIYNRIYVFYLPMYQKIQYQKLQETLDHQHKWDRHKKSRIKVNMHVWSMLGLRTMNIFAINFVLISLLILK